MSFSSIDKNITDQLTERWQAVINMIARHYDVPSCLVMKLEDDNIKVHLSSVNNGDDNPYQPGDAEHFDDSGLYCERVIKTQKPLQVINALTDPEWDHNPDIKLGMISYLGVPLNWPDQSPFGTLCVLDKKEREFPEEFRNLLDRLSNIFELELSLAYEVEQRKKAEAELRAAQEKLLSTRELEHFSLISQGVSHELGTPIGSCVTVVSHLDDICQQALQQENPTVDGLKASLTDIHSCSKMLSAELGRSSRLLNTLKQAAQSSGLPHQNVEIDLALCVDDAWSFFSDSERQSIVLKQLILLPQPILANYVALVDIFKQLFRNAIDHGFHFCEKPELTIKARPAGDQVVIEIEDNGCGMSEDIRQAALKPFFSSDRRHGKVGLGLNYVNNLVTNTLKGKMEIGPLEPGTCIRLTIPQTPPEA